MNWNVTVKLDVLDTYEPLSRWDIPHLPISLLDKSSPDCARENIFKIFSKLGIDLLPPVIEDLLIVALAVYATDLSVPRAITEDRWTRSLAVHIPVYEQQNWKSASPALVSVLEYLSGDRWQFEFRQREVRTSAYKEPEPLIDQACLFSGGVDSLVGAIDLLERDEVIGLVSHHGAGATHKIRTDVFERLETNYPETTIDFDFYVQPRKMRVGIGENTMRARSFLFLCLGVAVASVLSSSNRLVVAENGLISLNVPLTMSRLGSLSTRTTHPFFISSYLSLLTKLGVDTQIELPYKLQTKGEMVSFCANADLLKKLLPKTMSCTHPEAGRYHGGKPGIHCGYCVPCIIRRAAIFSALEDKTKYGIDVLRDEPGHDCDTGRDIRAIRMALARREGAQSGADLFSVLSTGPLEPASIAGYVDVYRRGIAEVRTFLNGGK